MKKLIILISLIFTTSLFAQAEFEKIAITENVQDLTADKVNVQSANGVLNWQLISDFQNNKPYFSTGLLKNGLLTINADNTKFDLSAGIGVYSDFSDPENVTSKVFNFPAFNAVSSPYIATSNITYVAVNYNGGSPTIVMQASKFSNTQLRDLVVVGAVVHSNFTTINTINNISSPSNDVGNSVADLFNFLGAKNQEGNVYSANGANLQLNKSAGVMLKYGANFHVDSKNPHNVFLPEQLSLTFRYRLRGGFEGTDRINIDTDNYDLNNVLTTVPPAKPYQIQTIFIPQTGFTRIQYGQDTYNTLADAIAAINTRKFVTETNLASQFVKVAYLVVKKGATSLNVAADADIRQATQFDGTASGGVAITYQSIIDALTYAPENLANKVTSLASANNTTYPTTQLLKNQLDLKANLTSPVFTGTPIAPTLKLTNLSDKYIPYNNSSLGLINSPIMVNGTDVSTDGIMHVVGALNINSDFKILNKASTDWINFATRDISGDESVLNLSRIGDVTISKTATLNGKIRQTYTAVVTDPFYDAFLSEYSSDFNGYNYHAIRSGSGTGGAIGAANNSTGTGSAIIANRYAGGEGNGIEGSKVGPESGDGVFGINSGGGTGNGTSGIISGGGSGHAIYGENVNGSGNSGYFLGGNGVRVISKDDSASSFSLIVGGATTTGLVVNGNGNTGVGVFFPSEKLEVAGNIKASLFIGSAALTGTPTAPTALTGNSTTQIATTAFAQGVRTSLLTEDNIFTGSQIFNDTVNFNNLVLLKSYTVATLPTGLIQGSIAYVTDGLSPTYRATATGGGSEKCLVFYDGTVWRF